MTKVNKCGIIADKFIDGWCKECASTCLMDEKQMIDKRIYEYAMKHGILSCGMFSESNFIAYFENHPCIEQEPKYVQKYLEQLKSGF